MKDVGRAPSRFDDALLSTNRTYVPIKELVANDH